MFNVYGTTISGICGDTATIDFALTNYVYEAGDVVYLSVKRKSGDTAYILQKVITPAVGTSEVVFCFEHEDTNDIAPGSYVYDVQVSLASGGVQTPIGPGNFILTGGVTHE